MIRFFLLLTTTLHALPDLGLTSHSDPSFEDYVKIQDYLENGERSELEALAEFNLEGRVLNPFRMARMRAFKVVDVDDPLREKPKLHVVPIHTGQDDLNCCVITYTSCNAPYAMLPLQLQRSLKDQGFKGHFLYRVGGWPFVHRGALRSIDTPYAFKPCMFKEAMALGYRYILWIDVAATPRRSLDQTLKALKKHHALFFKDPIPWTFPSFQYILKTRSHIREALQTDWSELRTITHLAAQCIAFDTKDRHAQKVIDAWYQLALGKQAFLSLAPEQIPLSFLVHKYLKKPKIYEPSDLSSLFATTPH